MKIESLKELQKFIQLCRKNGITDVKVDGMEFHLAPATPRIRKSKGLDLSDPLAQAKITLNGTDATAAKEAYNNLATDQQNKIETPDELSEDQLLMWSAAGGGIQSGPQ